MDEIKTIFISFNKHKETEANNFSGERNKALQTCSKYTHRLENQTHFPQGESEL